MLLSHDQLQLLLYYYHIGLIFLTAPYTPQSQSDNHNLALFYPFQPEHKYHYGLLNIPHGHQEACKISLVWELAAFVTYFQIIHFRKNHNLPRQVLLLSFP